MNFVQDLKKKNVNISIGKNANNKFDINKCVLSQTSLKSSVGGILMPNVLFCSTVFAYSAKITIKIVYTIDVKEKPSKDKSNPEKNQNTNSGIRDAKSIIFLAISAVSVIFMRFFVNRHKAYITVEQRIQSIKGK